MRQLRAVWTIVTVSGVLVAGCSGATTTPAATSGTSASTGDSSYRSPLEQYLNVGGQAVTFDAAAFEAKDKQVQEIISTCMKDQGFEYIPYTQPVPGAASGAGYGTREWAVQYGYGISTFDQAAATGASEDPNEAIVAAMSESEQNAYNQALYGGGFQGGVPTAAGDPGTAGTADPTAPAATAAATEPAEPTPAPSAPDNGTAVSIPEATDTGLTMTMPPLDQMGCFGKAQSEVYGDPTVSDPAMQDLVAALMELQESITADPRLATKVAEWSGCLADAGFTGFTTIDQPQQDLTDQWSELNGWGETITDSGNASGTAEGLGGSAAAPTTPAPGDLTKFRDGEIALAVADFDCQDKVGLRTLYQDVQTELENAFITEHKDELDRLRDQMNTGG